MRTSASHEVTRLLAEWRKGNERAVSELMPFVYGELRQLAAAYLRGERQGHTLQPTALVHEAYLRLVDQSAPDWQSRAHFYGVAARVMRQILVDHARRKQAKKRVAEPVTLQQVVNTFQPDRSDDLVALDDSLTDLEKIDARKSQAIELRYFAGLTMDEIAQAMNLSVESVRRDMRMAEAWLYDAMRSE
jgi:RNA polymerase sigma factor (TIGR02999 family)